MTGSSTEFAGFGEAALNFYDGLAADNSRSWNTWLDAHVGATTLPPPARGR